IRGGILGYVRGRDAQSLRADTPTHPHPDFRSGESSEPYRPVRQVPNCTIHSIATDVWEFSISMSMTLTDRTATQPSTTSFSRFGLRPATLAALAQMGITEPTPIQASAIPALMAGEDVMGQARTGSGKTLAFMLPAIERVDARQRQVQIMVLTPTRELAVQIADVTAQVAGQLSIVTIVGGRSDKPQVAALRRGAQVLIGTPGRILDLLQQGALMLNQLRFLVLDEADNLLDQGFGPDVDRIIKYANRSRQTALFSATMPDWVERAARKYLHEPR